MMLFERLFCQGKTVALSIGIPTCLCLFGCREPDRAGEQASPKQTSPEVQHSPEVQQLQAELIAILEDLESLTRYHFNNGDASHREVIEAKFRLARAKLTGTDLPAKKREILNTLIQDFKDLEKLEEERNRRGVTSGTAILNTKAARLQAEIMLKNLGG